MKLQTQMLEIEKKFSLQELNEKLGSEATNLRSEVTGHKSENELLTQRIEKLEAIPGLKKSSIKLEIQTVS